MATGWLRLGRVGGIRLSRRDGSLHISLVSLNIAATELFHIQSPSSQLRSRFELVGGSYFLPAHLPLPECANVRMIVDLSSLVDLQIQSRAHVY